MTVTSYYAYMALTSKNASPLLAVLYLRVSLDRYARLRARTDAEDRGSIPRQERAGLDLIDRRGWTLEATKFDPIGASIFTRREREQWPEVLALIEAGRCGVVILWESSRGDRRNTQWNQFLDLCAAKGTLIHILDDDMTYDVRKNRDWEYLAEEGIKNARESRKISARVTSAKAHLRETGRPEGSITYGHRSTYDAQTGILLGREPDPETAPFVRWAFEQFHSGESMRAIRDGLLELDPSRKWSTTAVRKMLVNVRHIGLIRDGSELRKAQWPAVVDETMFWEIQERLTANAEAGTRPGAVQHLCSYLAVAAPCGSYLQYVSPKQSAQQRAGRSRPFYKCHKDGCVGTRADWLDDYVSTLVIAYWARRDIREMLAAAAERSSSELAGLKRRKRELDAKLTEIGREGANLPVQTVVAMTQTIQAELEDVERRIAIATPVSARPLLEGNSLAEVEAKWHEMTMQGLIGAQREVIRGTLEHIVVHPRGRGFHRVFDPSFVDAPHITIG